jgi:hypothetical protein
MKILETASTFDLPDESVWVAGDWHGNVSWTHAVILATSEFDNRVGTIIQLGDFWPTDRFLRSIDDAAERAGIKRVLFLPGNHEPWPQLIQIEEDLAPGHAARISEVVWFLPRPFRFTVGKRTLLALGGASSVDAAWRTPGVDWWQEERISEAHEIAAINGGSVDVMLTHESPSGAVAEVQQIIDQSRLPHIADPPVCVTSALQRKLTLGAQLTLPLRRRHAGEKLLTDSRIRGGDAGVWIRLDERRDCPIDRSTA